MWLKINDFRFRFFHLLTMLMACALLGLSACKDKCEQYITVRQATAVPLSVDSIRAAVMPLGATSLKNPGKIYVKGDLLFINEKGAGVHIIDNSDARNPKNITFLQIPGNQDIAVKGNILYAQSYMDLLAFDISEAAKPKLVKRVENSLSAYEDGINKWDYNKDNNTLILYKEKLVTEPMGDCDNINTEPQYYDYGGGIALSLSASAVNKAATSGTGGSNARFAIEGNYLYTVANSSMQLFNISDPAKPDTAGMVPMEMGAETVFPFENDLLVGTNNGVGIYDISNPHQPHLTSLIGHFCSNDPVVADGDYAYYTLHTGQNYCSNNIRKNELDVVDISNIDQPKDVMSYDMKDPQGLGINNKYLFVCEGEYGLKIYDNSNPLKLSDHLISWLKNIPAYDVIPMDNTILVVGDNGLYQFDISNPKRIKQLSKLSINKM